MSALPAASGCDYGSGGGGPPNLRRLTPGVVGTLQYSAPELINEDLRPQGE